MKKKIIAILVSSLFITGCSSSSNVNNLTLPEFVSKMAEPGVIIVDVRTPEEYAAGHIQGALNIDVNGNDFDLRISALDKNAIYAVYCRSGNRSTLATNKMADADFTNIYNFNKGGFAELANAGVPVE